MTPRYEVRRLGARIFAVIDTRDHERVIETFSRVDFAVSFRDAMNQGRVCHIPERRGAF